MKGFLNTIAALFALTTVGVLPVLAQEEPASVLTEADLIAAIDEACDCTVAEDPVDPATGEEEEETKLRNCIPTLKKLRKSIEHVLKPLGLIDQTIDSRAFTKDQSKRCREARKEVKKKEKANKGNGANNGNGKNKGNKGDHQDDDDDDDDDSEDDDDDSGVDDDDDDSGDDNDDDGGDVI